MKNWIHILPFLILFLFGQVLSQGGGKIIGTVTDSETNEPLPGCNILIEGTLLGAASDEDGYFMILNVPPGTYDVSAVMVGYVKKVQEGVKVVSNLTTKLEYSLRPELIEGEAITVEAYRTPLVQKDLTYKIQSVTGEEISRIPISTVGDILAQQAGVTQQIVTSPVSSLPVFGQFATIPTDGVHFRGGRVNEALYLFDGVNVTDGLWGGYSISPIPEALLSSMEAFTGTFGPEYGNAMSGVVNIASYDQIDLQPKISVKAFTDNIGLEDESHNTNSYEVFASSGLPFTDKVGIVAAHRLYSTDGYINGYIYPEYVNSDGTDKSGDPEEVPMQYQDTQFSFGKIIWKPAASIKAVFGGYHTETQRGLYNHYFKYNPYGTPRVQLEDNLLYGRINVFPSKSNYFTLSFANTISRFQSRVFNNPEFYEVRPQNGTAEFSISGEDWVYFNTHFRRTEFGLDYSNQLNKVHNVSAGGTYNQLKTVLARKNPDGFGVLEDYFYEPLEVHGYIKDKMEFDEMGMVVNIGARIDYIDPKRKVLENLSELSNLNAELEEAEPLTYVTPRLGISFPIFEDAAFRFGYGHYYQFPNYFKVFQGTFLVESTQNYRPNPQLENSPIGDNEIKPEKTINYEAGVQTRLSNDISLDVVGFYRKTSNLIGVLLSETNEGRRFQVMGNIDYATVKGIELSLKKKFSENFSGSLNYTFSKTLVSTSVLFDRPTDEARTFPANWDQPHVARGHLYFRFQNGFGFSVYGSASSGLPYTQSIFDPNGQRAPWIHALDLNVFKNLDFFGIRQQVFLQILNVVNRKNVWWVYADSGIPGDDTSEATSHDYTNNPAMWGPGRTIQIGIRLWN